MSRPEPWLMALVAKNGLDNLCRVCLASGNADLGYTLINIFEPPNDTASGFSKADVLHTICDIEISQKDLCATQYNTANSEMASDEESASDTEYDKELLFEVEYLNVSELSLKDDNTFEKGQTSKQAKKIIRCCGCDTVFETELQLRKHSIRKHRSRSEVDVPDGKVSCNVCFALFPNKFTAAMHKRGKNSVQPLMKCKFCGCIFFTKKGMIKHRRQFHKGQRHKCCRCSFSSKDKNELIEHSICHKTNSNEEERAKAYQCKLCDSRFQTLQERRLHERLPYRIRRKKKRIKKVSEEATVPANWCCGCGRVFSSISELNAHQDKVHLPNRLEHNEENPIECDGCYKRFKTDNILKQHLRKNATRKRFFCDKCNAVRLSPEEMMQHQLSHTGKNAFLCCGCRMRFESNEQLEQHALQEHANRPKIYYNDEEDTERSFRVRFAIDGTNH
nr:zinc finger protein 320-like isoform X4 [Aedes albopictus]